MCQKACDITAREVVIVSIPLESLILANVKTMKPKVFFGILMQMLNNS